MMQSQLINMQADGQVKTLKAANDAINSVKRQIPSAVADKFRSSIRFVKSELAYNWCVVLK